MILLIVFMLIAWNGVQYLQDKQYDSRLDAIEACAHNENYVSYNERADYQAMFRQCLDDYKESK